MFFKFIYLFHVYNKSIVCFIHKLYYILIKIVVLCIALPCRRGSRPDGARYLSYTHIYSEVVNNCIQLCRKRKRLLCPHNNHSHHTKAVQPWFLLNFSYGNKYKYVLLFMVTCKCSIAKFCIPKYQNIWLIK